MYQEDKLLISAKRIPITKQPIEQKQRFVLTDATSIYRNKYAMNLKILTKYVNIPKLSLMSSYEYISIDVLHRIFGFLEEA